MGRRRFEIIKDELAEKLKKATVATIAVEYGVSPPTIYKKIKQYSILYKRPKRLNKFIVSRETLIDLLNYSTVDEILWDHNISEIALANAIKSHKLKKHEIFLYFNK